jgi:hypothetical protein
MLGHLQIQTNYMLSLLLNYSKAKYKRLTYLQIQLIELLTIQTVIIKQMMITMLFFFRHASIIPSFKRREISFKMMTMLYQKIPITAK